jgi:hypothetical protein
MARAIKLGARAASELRQSSLNGGHSEDCGGRSVWGQRRELSFAGPSSVRRFRLGHVRPLRTAFRTHRAGSPPRVPRE